MSTAYWLACALISEGRACFWTGVELEDVAGGAPPVAQWPLGVECRMLLLLPCPFFFILLRPFLSRCLLLLPHGLASNHTSKQTPHQLDIPLSTNRLLCRTRLIYSTLLRTCIYPSYRQRPASAPASAREPFTRVSYYPSRPG